MKKYNNLFQIKYILLLVFIVSVIFVGCSAGDGGLSDWQNNNLPSSAQKVNVKGKILSPSYNAQSVRTALALPTLEGVRVFVESDPSVSSQTDVEGNFFMQAVPVGQQRFVAYVDFAGSSYRQRSAPFFLDGNYETMILSSNIRLAEAKHSVQVHVSDVLTGQPVFADVSVWGFTEKTINGFANLGPFPDSLNGEEVKISAIGYKPLNFILSFKDSSKAEIYVKMTPLTSVTGNRAPIAEIIHDSKEIGTNEMMALTASGLDPDGDVIEWQWQADYGKFTNEKGANTVYTAPSATGTVLITLFATDPEKAQSRAVLKLDVYKSSSNPTNANNRAPLTPSEPSPANNAEGQGGQIDLRWACSDPDGDKLKYDVLLSVLGTELTLVGQNLTKPSFTVANLNPYTNYNWQIIARDELAASTNSPIWKFKTGDLNNNYPYTPVNTMPIDNSTGQATEIVFSWTGGDPDETDTLTYELLLGKTADSLLSKGKTNQTKLKISGLDLATKYYWQIIASDNRGKEKVSPVWSFTTQSPANRKPNTPIAILPLNDAVSVSLGSALQWEATDPDGDLPVFDVYFGTSQPLQKVSASQGETYYIHNSGLGKNTKYFWQIIARDPYGATNDDAPIWSFTTTSSENSNPTKPTAVSPVPGSTNAASRPVIAWECSDPDGDMLTYDLYVSTSSTFELENLVASNISAKNWTPTDDLTPGALHYWQVLAKDSAGGQTYSDVFTFWVKGTGVIDNTPPYIVSVFPANNAVNVDQGDSVRVVFSEPVEQAIAVAGFSFAPDKPGSWVWENASTVSFMPTEQWLPGSYNKFIIAGNSIKDLSGNTMSQGGSYTFTVRSDLPVPTGYKSAGFPVSVLSSENKTITVSGLSSGKNLYGLAVAGSAGANVVIKGSVTPAGIEKYDSHSKFRYLEKEFGVQQFPQAVSGANQSRSSSVTRGSTISVGETDSFILLDDSEVVASPGVIEAECMAVSDNFIIFRDTTVTSLSAAFFSEMRARCEDNIYPALSDAFGNGPVAGPNGEPRTAILLTDNLQTDILGYFYYVDLYDRNPFNQFLKNSNERKIIYMNADIDNSITRYGTIAHEMQHMINYYHKNNNGVYEEDWLNEAMSKYAEEITGFGIPHGDANTVNLIKESQMNFDNLSLTDWSGLNSYGLSYLFAKFLTHEGRYKTLSRDVTRALVQSSKVGKSNIESVTDEDFELTLARWGLSLYINNHGSASNEAYGINGFNLKGTYNGVTLPGFNYVGAVLSPTISLKPYGVRGFIAMPKANGIAEVKLENPTANMKVYLFDSRP